MAKRTIVDRIEIDLRAGSIGVRMQKQTVADEDVTFDYHRTLIPAGVDVDTAFGLVNAHLKQLGYPAVAPADLDRIKAHAALCVEIGTP